MSATPPHGARALSAPTRRCLDEWWQPDWPTFGARPFGRAIWLHVSEVASIHVRNHDSFTPEEPTEPRIFAPTGMQQRSKSWGMSTGLLHRRLVTMGPLRLLASVQGPLQLLFSSSGKGASHRLRTSFFDARPFGCLLLFRKAVSLLTPCEGRRRARDRMLAPGFGAFSRAYSQSQLAGCPSSQICVDGI